jgi:hypothetical protein
VVAAIEVIVKFDTAVAIVDGNGEPAQDGTAKEPRDLETCSSAQAWGIEGYQVIVFLLDPGEVEDNNVAGRHWWEHSESSR